MKKTSKTYTVKETIENVCVHDLEYNDFGSKNVNEKFELN